MTSYPKPVAVAFDWDGTLVNTTDLIVSSIEKTCDHFSVMHRDTFRPYFGVRAPRDYYPDLFGTHVKEATAYYYAIIEAEHLKKLQVIEGAEALLKTLVQKNLPLFVVSNKRHDLLVSEIGHLAWNQYFQDWIGGGVLAREKPAPDQLLHVLSSHGITAGPHVWFVGDTDVDEACAKAAQCTSVIINNTNIRKNDEYSPNISFPQLLGLQNLINDII